ncbi:tyrosine-type recombinase/integrase [Nonomuraea sp. NEAU-A123]|uniref:tyrosine-type recombinase/integrase n=1 Tax=Nonomuraea sp. NEAU-A123 TaxID=2839649 RepID=UPI001BE44C24|nr:tyrosine-type recombinase/integrase [Nonomuraea sp. NEAU-A123]MBT2234778.1 tyrosine-type recombinase/integrase [Nonomuraea sp. NEAU-A123]
MTAELIVAQGEEVALPLDLPPLILDLTRAWLWSYDSPNTREAYERNIRRWFQFCAETGLDPLEARKPHGDVFSRWFQETARRPPKPKTVAQVLSSVSSWYEYLHETEALDANRFKKTRRPKIPRKHTETVALTKSEAQDLLRAADFDHGRERLRTSALLRLLLQTGVRISEAVNAQIGDLGFARGYRTLRITVKGGDTITRRLPVETTHALDAYLAERARCEGVELQDLKGPLFATSTGRTWDRSKAFELVRRIAKQAGITSKVSPHSLRHTYASVAEEAGVTMRQIQLDLNHADVSTTEIYLHSRDRLEKDASQIVASAIE